MSRDIHQAQSGCPGCRQTAESAVTRISKKTASGYKRFSEANYVSNPEEGAQFTP